MDRSPMDSRSRDITEAYATRYAAQNPSSVYPVEFVVRAFLGRYPRLTIDKTAYSGKKVLDLGFGDGRNMPLLNDLGMAVHGVEIAEDICKLAEARMARLGVKIITRVGRNNRIPFDQAYFDYVLACHACYYVDPGTRFDDNVREIARVLKPGGTFVFSAPMADGYILKGAKDLGEGHMQVTNDPYGLRNGSILKKFDRESDIVDALSPTFQSFAIGKCRNDFWGVEEYGWIVVCRRASAAGSDA